MLFQQLIYQQGFFALRSNNAEMDKKARRSRLTQYLLQQKSFPFKKKNRNSFESHKNCEEMQHRHFF